MQIKILNLSPSTTHTYQELCVADVLFSMCYLCDVHGTLITFYYKYFVVANRSLLIIAYDTL